MKYLSLFTGIGGFELGIKQAYESLQNLHDAKEYEHEATDTASMGQRWLDTDSKRKRLDDTVCVGYSEIDKYACQIYQKQFPNHTNYGDITQIKEKELPDFDLIVGGFPCQSFSIAGKRGGFSDTRGTLFFDIARLIKAKQPRLLLLENVKGLLSHDEGRTFRIIIATLDELGYDIQWQVLNSKNHGVPQNRERVFIVGHLRGTARPKVFPIGESDSWDIKTPEESQGKGERIRSDVASTLAARDYKGGGNLIQFIQQKPRGNNKGGKKKIAPTMTGQTYKDNNHVNGVRRLTPTECERLQGFPDGWTEGVSDTQRYKTLGNAVTVNVIRDIMIKLSK